MQHTGVLVVAALAGWLTLAANASAQRFRGYRPVSPVVSRGYFPARSYGLIGPPWTWPRNPYIVPVPYPYPYAYPYPAPAPWYSYSASTPSPATVAAESALANEVTVSGPLSSPPPGSALIVVRVPQNLATIRFDGESTYSLGLQRYFVTPELQPGKSYRYDMVASWTAGGQTRRVERAVRVQAGQTVRLDLTR